MLFQPAQRLDGLTHGVFLEEADPGYARSPCLEAAAHIPQSHAPERENRYLGGGAGLAHSV